MPGKWQKNFLGLIDELRAAYDPKKIQNRYMVRLRGSARLLEGREPDVARVYQSENEEDVREILEKYQVRYVYLGRREISSYGAGKLASFDNLLRTAFTAEGVIIYETLP